MYFFLAKTQFIQIIWLLGEWVRGLSYAIGTWVNYFFLWYIFVGIGIYSFLSPFPAIGQQDLVLGSTLVLATTSPW